VADENDASREWVVEPPRPGEVLFRLNLGEGVTLTEEQEAAVYELMQTLESGDAEYAEVTGHSIVSSPTPKCPHLQTCSPLACPPLSCGVLSCGKLTAIRGAAPGFGIMGTFGLT
jgi:hypothetical protein